MRIALIFLVLAGCATPHVPDGSKDFGFGGYFDSPGEFAAWLNAGCYDHGTRVSCSTVD